jgi:predicted nucleic acid-binding protein
LCAFLRAHRRIALDTSIFIYQLEANARYVALSDEVFTWLEEPGHTAVTSTIALTELLVKPYLSSDERSANEINALLSTYPNLDWVAPDLLIASLAARYRAEYRLKTPDAIQAATAVRSRATAFITNDSAFERVPAYESFLLSHFI